MTRRFRSHVSALLVTGALGSGLVLACGGSSSNGTDPGSGGSSGSGNGNGNGNGGSGGPGGTLGGGNGGGGPSSADAACAATSSKGQQAPLDIFIMLDQSGSMTDPVATGGDKWSAITGALTSFVGSPQNGVSVGIGYFGIPGGGGGGCVDGATCTTDADCNGGTCRTTKHTCRCGTTGGGDSCNAADYAKPDVEIAALPGVGSKITASIAAHSPSTETPTAPALQGAIQHATDWAKAHTGDVTIVVFATDGDPTECTPQDIPSISQIAAAGVSGTPKILTFVIGVGTSTSNLNAIAQGGGTNAAFIVDTGGNAQQQFLDALNKIRGSALGCNYQIPLPTTGSIDYGSINVQYTPGNGGAPVTIPKVSDKGSCPANGEAWYYDNNNAPTQIVLCDATCNTILGDKGGEVDVLVGCATVVK
jgi:hypothetical protein